MLTSLVFVQLLPQSQEHELHDDQLYEQSWGWHGGEERRLRRLLHQALLSIKSTASRQNTMKKFLVALILIIQVSPLTKNTWYLREKYQL